MAPSVKLVLYSYWRSSCSWRVRIALGWKKLPFECNSINLLEGEHKSDSYSLLNPSRMVPLLCVISQDSDSMKISQSIAIMEYLEESFPSSPHLLPEQPYLRAKVREIVGIIACDIQPLQNLRVLKQFQTQAEKDTWSQNWIRSGFQGNLSHVHACVCMYILHMYMQ